MKQLKEWPLVQRIRAMPDQVAEKNPYIILAVV